MPVTINGNGAISGLVITTTDLQDGSVTTAKVADSNITSAKIADGTIATADLANASVTVAKISATGTADSTTYLRGDGSWQAVSTTPTTAQVLSATAGASVGAVGTYAFLINTGTSTVAPGGTVAGSNLRYASVGGQGTGDGWQFTGASGSSDIPSGTWRVMGRARYGPYTCVSLYGISVWLRIS